MQKRLYFYLFICILFICAGVIGIYVSATHYDNDYDCIKYDNCTYSLRYDDREHANRCAVSLPKYECWTWALGPAESCPNTTVCYLTSRGCPLQKLPLDHKNLCQSGIPFLFLMLSLVCTIICCIVLCAIIHSIRQNGRKYTLVSAEFSS